MVATITSFAQENVVKIKPLGLIYGNYTVSYERVINEKNSASISLGFISLNSVTLVPNWYYEWDGCEKGIVEDSPWIGELHNGFNVSIDYRFYTNEVLKNFYYGPYLKYLSLGFKLEDEIEGPYYTIESTVKEIGAGIEIGNQWMLSNNISLDLYMGIGAQLFSAKGTYVQDQAPCGFDYSTIVLDVTDAYEKIPYVHKNLETTVEPNDLLLEIPLFLPDFRFGFTVGFAF